MQPSLSLAHGPGPYLGILPDKAQNQLITSNFADWGHLSTTPQLQLCPQLPETTPLIPPFSVLQNSEIGPVSNTVSAPQAPSRNIGRAAQMVNAENTRQQSHPNEPLSRSVDELYQMIATLSRQLSLLSAHSQEYSYGTGITPSSLPGDSPSGLSGLLSSSGPPPASSFSMACKLIQIAFSVFKDGETLNSSSNKYIGHALAGELLRRIEDDPSLQVLSSFTEKELSRFSTDAAANQHPPIIATPAAWIFGTRVNWLLPVLYAFLSARRT